MSHKYCLQYGKSGSRGARIWRRNTGLDARYWPRARARDDSFHLITCGDRGWSNKPTARGTFATVHAYRDQALLGIHNDRCEKIRYRYGKKRSRTIMEFLKVEERCRKRSDVCWVMRCCRKRTTAKEITPLRRNESALGIRDTSFCRTG